MIALLGGVLTVVLVGIPVLSAPSDQVVALGVLAAVLCVCSVVLRSIPWFTAGAIVALVQYALALFIAARPPDLIGATAFGVTLALLLQIVGFRERFRPATTAPEVLWEHARFWITAGLATAALCGLIGVAALLAVFPARLPVYPAVAAFGVLVAFLGLVRGILRPERLNATENPLDRARDLCDKKSIE